MTGSLGRLESGAWVLLFGAVGVLAALLAGASHPLLPVTLVVGAGVVALACLRPLVTLLLGFLLVPLESLAVPLGALTLSPSETLFLLTAFAWAAGRMVAGRRPWTTRPLAGPLLLLWLAGLAGIFVAEDPGAVLRLELFWGAFLLLFAMIAEEADDAYLRLLLLVLTAVGAVAGVTAVLGSSGAESPQLSSLGDTATGRAVGAFSDPNILATFLAMALPAALYVTFEGRWRRAPIALAGTGLILFGLALSLSRGGILAAAGALLVMLAWAPVRRLALIGVLVLAAFVVIDANPFGDVQQVQTVVDRVESVGAQGGSGADERGLVYRETPRLIADHWAFGVGALNYPNIAPRYGIVEPLSGLTYEHAHNVVLTIGAELGVLGLLALAWLAAVVLRWAPAVCGPRAGPRRGIGLAVTAALVALALQGLVDFTLRSNIIAAFAFVALGAFAALARPRDEPAPPTRQGRRSSTWA